MKKICITLDDVLRSKTEQIFKIYKKYIDNDFDVDNVDKSNHVINEVLGMTKKEYNKFLYEDYPFEIFGEATTTSPMIDKMLINWHIGLDNVPEIEEKLELTLANPFEFNASIGFTHFFLSKMATRVRETYFPWVSSTIWDTCDILITAEPALLNTKPEGKIAIKIDTEYNKESPCDYHYEGLKDFICNYEELKKVLNVG